MTHMKCENWYFDSSGGLNNASMQIALLFIWTNRVVHNVDNVVLALSPCSAETYFFFVSTEDK